MEEFKMIMKNIFVNDGFIYPYVWRTFYDQIMLTPSLGINDPKVQRLREYYEENSKMDITKIQLETTVKGEKVLVDSYIHQLIEAFNKKGFPTSFSCSGHLEDCFEGFYIRFNCKDLTNEKRKALKDLCKKCNIIFEHDIQIFLAESRDFNECRISLTKHDTGLFKSSESYELDPELYRCYIEMCKKEWHDEADKNSVLGISPNRFLYEAQVDEYNDIRLPIKRTTREYTELSENELKEKFRYMVKKLTQHIINVNLLD